MNPLAPAYEKALNNHPGFGAQQPSALMYSSVTARRADPDYMGTGAYWAANMVSSVQFSDAFTGILLDESDGQNLDAVLEIGAHPALKGPSRQIFKSLKLEIPYFGALTRGTPDFEGLLTAAGQLFGLGYPVNLEAANSDHYLSSDHPITVPTGKRLENFPTYAWDHSSFWAETRVIRSHRLRKHRHTILGAPVPGCLETRPRWRNYLHVEELPWLMDHVVDGKVIFPAAGYISMAIEAAARLDDGPEYKQFQLRDISVRSALVVSTKDTGTEILLELSPVIESAKTTSSTWYDFSISSFDESGRQHDHCTGLISYTLEGAPSTLLPPSKSTKKTAGEISKLSTRSLLADKYYNQLGQLGLQYGPTFQLCKGSVECGPGIATSSLVYNCNTVSSHENDATILHPSLLDASLHPLFAAIEAQQPGGGALKQAFVPTFVRSLRVSSALDGRKHAQDDLECTVAADTELKGSRVVMSDLRIGLKGQENGLLFDAEGFQLTALGGDNEEDGPGRSLFFRTVWEPAFDLLDDVNASKRIHSVADAVDLYAHQHPDAKILHVSQDPEQTLRILRALQRDGTSRRRIRSLTVVPSDNLDGFEAVAKAWPDTLKVGSEDDEKYDLVVLENEEQEPTARLADDGIILSILPLSSHGDLQTMWSTSTVSAFQNKKKECPGESISILMPSSPSHIADSVADTIESLVSTPVSRLSLLSLRTTPVSGRVVVLASLGNEVLNSQKDGAAEFQAVQTLLTKEGINAVWVTTDALIESRSPQHAVVFGLARSARSENDRLRLVLLDVTAEHSAEQTSKQIVAMLDPTVQEDEVADRGNGLLIPRIVADDALNAKLPNGIGHVVKKEPLYQENRPLALRIGRPGLLETLSFAEDTEILNEPLGDDEIEIEVKASAINFRDIAASMGIIDDYKLGDECAGIVLRTGSAVSPDDFTKGDRVVAWRPGQGAHRTICRNPAPLCYKLTGPLDFSIATALPLILTTAHYALIDTARLQKGETVVCILYKSLLMRLTLLTLSIS